MSAIAQILLARGVRVSGSDSGASAMLDRLHSLGAEVSVGHDAAHVRPGDVVVLSDAIKPDNPEWRRALALGLPVVKRAELLGYLTNTGRGIAVSGAHGKTTTSGMLALMLLEGGLDPSCVLGGELAALGGNARAGSSLMLVEACEAYNSFLDLHPEAAIVTNIDVDHLDFHKTPEHLYESFRTFLRQVRSFAVLNGDDPLLREMAAIPSRAVLYGAEKFNEYRFDEVQLGGEKLSSKYLSRDDAEIFVAGKAEFSKVYGDIHGENSNAASREKIKSDPAKTLKTASETSFTLRRGSEELERIVLRVPGLHNVSNATGAAAMALELGVSLAAVKRALYNFPGMRRRFERLGRSGEVEVVDDYAHHPTEIRATLTSARSVFPGRVVAVFQPHLYSRTRDLLEEFANALALADVVLIAPIYAAREAPIPGVDHVQLAQRIIALAPQRTVVALASLDEAVRVLAHATGRAGESAHSAAIPTLKNGDVIITIGAGDVNTVAYTLKELEERS